MTDFVAPWVDRIIVALQDPIAIFANPEKRMFWPFLLSGLVIALAVCCLGRGERSPRRFWHALFPAGFWKHPSTLLDGKLIVAKSVIRVLLFAPWMVSAYGLAVGLVAALDSSFGYIEVTSLSTTTITVVYTLALVVTWDFSRYLLHRLAHTVPLLWEFHKVHHSAELMTPLTLYRSHPIENLLFMLRGVLTTGVVTGVFFYFFRERAVQYQLVGVNALGFVFNLLGANLRHSHLWLSFGPVLERVFISPAQHQIHHSIRPEHHGRNYGSCLALWDWIGGSLYVTGRRESLTFGLEENDSNHDPHSLTSALIGPVAACLARIAPRRMASRWE